MRLLFRGLLSNVRSLLNSCSHQSLKLCSPFLIYDV
jgi:hypothetical protein